MRDLVQERSGGDILKDAIRLTFSHFPTFFLIYYVPVLPGFLLIFYLGLGAGEISQAVLDFSYVLFALFPYGALTIAISQIFIGQKPSLNRSYRKVFRVWPSYLATYSLFLLVFVAGLVLFIIPGLVALGLWVFALSVSVIERRGALASFARSRQLVKGSFLRVSGIVLGLLIVYFLAVYTVVILVDASVSAIFGPAELTFRLAEGLITPLIDLFSCNAFVLLYYDMRIRKEGYDAAALTQELMA